MAIDIKILSMDGGNGLNTAEMLSQLESVDCRRFLDQANVFTGTSAGGINALYFAASESPTAALAELKDFWNEINKSLLAGLRTQEARRLMQDYRAAAVAALEPARGPEELIRTVFGLSLAALGLRSLFVNDAMKALLLERFGDMRMGDISYYKRGLVIVAFQLDGQSRSQSSNRRSWGPKLYSNLPHTVNVAKGYVSSTSNIDAPERVVDVAMRTSAAPLELPIYQSLDGSKGGPGFVDGGLVANNPCMIALAAIAGSLAKGSTSLAPQPTFQTLGNTWLLSVGTGSNLFSKAQFLTPEFTNGSAAWGYQKWLFDLSNPLVLVDAFLEGGNESAAFQSRMLLGDDNFKRLNVPIKGFLVDDDDPETRKAVAETAVWLRDSGWMQPNRVPIPLSPVSERSASAHGGRLRSRP
jgi:uncharacterized protein